ARAHHEVVAAAAESGPVAPVRLATVYHDDQSVRALLHERAADFRAALDRVRGRVEWGVKAFAAPTADDTADAGAAPGSGDGSARPGTSYLLRRRAERDRAGTRLEAATAAAEALHRELTDLAVANRRYEPQDPRLSGHREPMVLNAAYLVDEVGGDALREL